MLAPSLFSAAGLVVNLAVALAPPAAATRFAVVVGSVVFIAASILLGVCLAVLVDLPSRRS